MNFEKLQRLPVFVLISRGKKTAYYKNGSVEQ